MLSAENKNKLPVFEVDSKNIQITLCEVCGGPLNNRTLKKIPIYGTKVIPDLQGKLIKERVITGFKMVMNMAQKIRFCSKNCRRQRHRRDVLVDISIPMSTVFRAKQDGM